MGLLDRLRRWIDPPKAPEPEEWVVLTVVPFSDGPMLHSAIVGAGIEAVMEDVRALPAHGMDKHRIIVRQRDLLRARQIARDLRGPGLAHDPFLELE